MNKKELDQNTSETLTIRKDILNVLRGLPIDSKDLNDADWIYKKLGLGSLYEYIASDLENIVNAYHDPTLYLHTEFYKSVKQFNDNCYNLLKPWNLYYALMFWIKSKSLEKINIQIYTHLFSNKETKSIAADLKQRLSVQNAFQKSQNKYRNIDWTIKSFDEIERNSNLTPVECQTPTSQSNHNYFHQTIFLNASFQNYEIATRNVKQFKVVNKFNAKTNSRLRKISVFLEKNEFIDDHKLFIEVILNFSNRTSSKKVVWRKELSSLCFLISALIVRGEIETTPSWAKNTSENFLCDSQRKNNPEISPESLTTLKNRMNLAGMSQKIESINPEFLSKKEIKLIREFLLKTYK